MLKIVVLFLTLSTSAHADWDCPFWPDMGQCTDLDPPQYDFGCQARVTSSTMNGYSKGETLQFELGATRGKPVELFARIDRDLYHGELGSHATRTSDYAEINDEVRFDFGPGHLHVRRVELWPDYHASELDAYCGSVLPLVTTH